jgi:hypothetical protein
MPMFKKKPVVIEAVRYTGDNYAELQEFLTGARETTTGPAQHSDRMVISTLEGDLNASPGDWIIKGVKGEFYPCKPDIFEALYDPEPS